MPAERWSGKPRPVEAQEGPGECRMLFSLGNGVSGGLKYVDYRSSHDCNAYGINPKGTLHMVVSSPRC